jgi:hypothetical protein
MLMARHQNSPCDAISRLPNNLRNLVSRVDEIMTLQVSNQCLSERLSTCIIPITTMMFLTASQRLLRTSSVSAVPAATEAGTVRQVRADNKQKGMVDISKTKRQGDCCAKFSYFLDTLFLFYFPIKS